MKQVTIPAQWLQELIALCGPEDHELRERVMKSAAPAPADALDEARVKRCNCGAGTLLDCLSNSCRVVRARAAQAATATGLTAQAVEVDDHMALADALDPESDYQRGYRHGYNRRDAEVQGALL